MRKIITIVVFLLVLSFVQAINLEINHEPLQNSFIVDLNEPATYNLTIKNLGSSDSFEIYSLVGVDIKPNKTSILTNETKSFVMEIIPQTHLKSQRGPFNFVYKIKNSKNEIVEERLIINIVDLASSFSLKPEDINPNSEEIVVSIENKLNYNFENINIKLNSVFFEHEELISLKPKEKIELRVPLNKDKLSTLNAGKYLMEVNLKYLDSETNLESKINFVEQENVETLENEEGFFVRKKEVIKKNSGNTENAASITISRNLISYLFTTVEPNPDDTNFNWFSASYVWNENLSPGEQLKVSAVTNWFYPLIILILIVFGFLLIKNSIYPDIALKKKVSFVKTKGGQFALKVSIMIKAKRFIEKIKITDKLPQLVELYDKFGTITPDVIDMKHKKLEWSLNSLNSGESRVFSYIIYSKIGVVGKFELPNASAVYEKDGKIKQITSNKSFYVNEPKKISKPEE
ncbi:hypothetical protein J4221_06305 [Candidatus Pacearchaeota archaeon]|nr:hypothetical protein [Candidatus Pacearchaeota archaeon]